MEAESMKLVRVDGKSDGAKCRSILEENLKDYIKPEIKYDDSVKSECDQECADVKIWANIKY